jgi:hypothetical protein
VVKKHNLTFPVLMDKDNHYAEQLGLTFPLPEKLQQVYLGFGIDLERFSGNSSWVLPMCGRFIIDSTGIIRDAEVHPGPYNQARAERNRRFYQIDTIKSPDKCRTFLLCQVITSGTERPIDLPYVSYLVSCLYQSRQGLLRSCSSSSGSSVTLVTIEIDTQGSSLRSCTG